MAIPVSSHYQLRLPLIRKVIRQGGKFMCSLCRTPHDTMNEANVCLTQCWFDIYHFYPVVLRKLQAKVWVYRCHFCCRDYSEEESAQRCAQHCLGIKNKLHISEQLMFEEPIGKPQSTVSRIRARQAAMLAEQARLRDAYQAKPVTESKAQQPSEPPQAEPDPTPQASEEKKGRHKSAFAKQWIRMNEKYQCSYCKVLHFTKRDADDCFGKHFGDDDFEREIAELVA